MKNRAWAVAVCVLAIAGGFVGWRLLIPDSAGPAPTLAPSFLPRPAEAELPPVANPFGSAPALPAELSADDFSRMIEAFSEPGGFFMYENYLSNERSYQNPIPALLKVAKPGGVYLGVGPEQNFTYIAALRPAMAFIIDIRRQNMLELLMYKALFAMAANRAEFVSLLFSRMPLERVDENASAEELFRAFSRAPADRDFYETNLKRIYRELRLPSADERTLGDVYHVFFSTGPDLSYSSTNAYAPSGPSYEDLMTLSDDTGRNWSYLASEENFRFIKEMQRRNLIVPVVGDFAGPKAIRSVAAYIQDHAAKVSAFYLSNVEMYILASPQWKRFCGNVASLPLDQSSVFIRFLLGAYARAIWRGGIGPRNVSVVSPMIDVLTGVRKGYPPSYYDLIYASR
jgi:hypothetical protein